MACCEAMRRAQLCMEIENAMRGFQAREMMQIAVRRQRMDGSLCSAVIDAFLSALTPSRMGQAVDRLNWQWKSLDQVQSRADSLVDDSFRQMINIYNSLFAEHLDIHRINGE